MKIDSKIGLYGINNQRPPAEPVVWRRLLEGAAAGGR